MSDWRTHFKAALVRNRWTQTRLADEIGVPLKTFANWMSTPARGEPSASHMVAMAEVTGLTLDELFRGLSPPETPDWQRAIEKATERANQACEQVAQLEARVSRLEAGR